MSVKKYKIHVPATTANVGPGFDVCGIALSLALTVEVSIPTDGTGEPTPTITYSGLDSDNVPLSPYKNLLTRVALYVLRCNGIDSFPAGVQIHAHNEIPFGRGLGSSGAAVIAGVLLGNVLGDLKLSTSRLLDFALMVERHPDNVTAALVGGFVGSYLRELSKEDIEAASVPLAEVLPEYPPDAGPNWGAHPPQAPLGIGHYVRFGWAPEIKAIAVMPRFELATAKSRGVLPDTYTRKDMVSMGVERWNGVRKSGFRVNLANGDDWVTFVFSMTSVSDRSIPSASLGDSPSDVNLID
jgi:homoserine kinase